MCKRTYELQKTKNNDTSYRSFLCVLLIFITLCSGISSSSSESWQKKSVAEKVEQIPGYTEDRKRVLEKSRESTTKTTTTKMNDEKYSPNQKDYVVKISTAYSTEEYTVESSTAHSNEEYTKKLPETTQQTQRSTDLTNESSFNNTGDETSKSRTTTTKIDDESTAYSTEEYTDVSSTAHSTEEYTSKLPETTQQTQRSTDLTNESSFNNTYSTEDYTDESSTAHSTEEYTSKLPETTQQTQRSTDLTNESSFNNTYITEDYTDESSTAHSTEEYTSKLPETTQQTQRSTDLTNESSFNNTYITEDYTDESSTAHSTEEYTSKLPETTQQTQRSTDLPNESYFNNTYITEDYTDEISTAHSTEEYTSKLPETTQQTQRSTDLPNESYFNNTYITEDYTDEISTAHSTEEYTSKLPETTQQTQRSTDLPNESYFNNTYITEDYTDEISTAHSTEEYTSKLPETTQQTQRSTDLTNESSFNNTYITEDYTDESSTAHSTEEYTSKLPETTQQTQRSTDLPNESYFNNTYITEDYTDEISTAHSTEEYISKLPETTQQTQRSTDLPNESYFNNTYITEDYTDEISTAHSTKEYTSKLPETTQQTQRSTDLPNESYFNNTYITEDYTDEISTAHSTEEYTSKLPETTQQTQRSTDLPNESYFNNTYITEDYTDEISTAHSTKEYTSKLPETTQQTQRSTDLPNESYFNNTYITEDYTDEISTAHSTEEYTSKLPETTQQTQRSTDLTNESSFNNTGDETSKSRTTTTTTRDSTPSATVCHTSECKSKGSRMLSLMNDSIDACEDFYAFSCGGVHKDNADSDAWNVLLQQMMQISNTSSDHLVKFKSFYNSCVEFQYQISHREKVNEVKDILKYLGFGSNESLESMELSEILSINLYLNSLQFMQIGFAYSSSTSRKVLQLKLPEESPVEIGLWSALWTNQRRCLTEQRRRIYEPDLNLTAVHESYSKCLRDNYEMEALVREACVNLDIQEEYLDETIEHIKNMMEIYPSQAEIKEAILGSKYTVFKVSDLQKYYPSITDWSKLFEKITNTTAPKNNLVNVYFKDYFKQWFKEFSKVKNKKHFLFNLLKIHLYYNFVLKRPHKDVETYCLKTTSSIFNDIASNLYLKHYKNETINRQKRRVDQIFDTLKEALATSLQKNDDLLTAAFKLNKMKIKFSTATETCDDHLLEAKYKTLQVYLLFQKNLVASLKFKMEHILDSTTYSFGNIVNTYETKPATFYEDSSTIYVPLGMVVEIPFNLPSHVALGMIGFPLAKAIGKHFDPVGIQTLELPKSFTNGFKKLIENTNDLYKEFINKIRHFTVNPNYNISLQDRISDNTALRLVTESYKNLNASTVMPWLYQTPSTNSTDKVLFLTVAQGLCEEENLLDFMLRFHENNDLPGPMRVNNIIQNSEYFSEVFKCPEGSEMNVNPFKSQFPHVDEEEVPEYYENYE